jgi:hypothetical protein
MRQIVVHGLDLVTALAALRKVLLPGSAQVIGIDDGYDDFFFV